MAGLHAVLVLICLILMTVTSVGGVELWSALGRAADLAGAEEKVAVYGPYFGRHFVLGLFTTICVLLAHTLAFIYFIGNSKGVREAVENHALDESFAVETDRLKRATLRHLSPAMLLFVAMSVVGMTSLSQLTPRYTHLVLIVLTIPYTLRTFWAAHVNLRLHAKLLDKMEPEYKSK